MKFGDNLKTIRKQRKISQEVLAEQVGVSRQSVSKWETGEAYPEMNNILQLCKIFRCHINDLVHEDMSDISSLDEEIKLNVVKFKKEQQKKMKGVSKAIYVISSILKGITTIGLVAVAICMLLVPIYLPKIQFKDSNILINDQAIAIEEIDTFEKAQTFFASHSSLEIIIYGEIVLICLGVTIFILIKLFKYVEKLFKNLHNGETPFTLENIEYIKSISKYLILYIVFPIITGYIMQFIISIELNVEVGIMDVIIILIAVSITYIFEYGYQIQLDSKGVMYDEK